MDNIKKSISLFISLVLVFSLINIPEMDVKAADIEVNFARLLQESLYFYDANMCGPKVSERSAFSWRGNCHLGDQAVNINGYTVNVSGGFHDAGDHLKAGLPQAYAATMLGIEYMEFKQAFEDTYSSVHLKTITNHFCEYFENCTVLNGDGSVAFFVYQVSDGDEDHKKWSSPESQNEVRHVYYTSDSNTATDEVSEAAAALALQYINFGDATALDYSKKLFNYAYSHTAMIATEGLYDSSTGGYLYKSESWGDDYALAAALLYKATGEAWYKTEFDNVKAGNGNYSNSGYNIWSWMSWDNVSMLADYYGTGNPEALYNCANNMYNGMQKDGGYGCLLQWGSARYNCNTQFLGLLYDKISNKSEYSNWATAQMRYLMGDNNQNQCFIVGYNSYSSKYPHHRAASASADAGQYSDNRHVLLGALVGGPKDSNGTYTDVQTDYQCNEVALDYNAGLVGAAAALYMLHKNDGTSTNKLMTEADFTGAGVEMRFSYNKENGVSQGTSGATGGTATGSTEGTSGSAGSYSNNNSGTNSGNNSGSNGKGTGGSENSAGNQSGKPSNEWINGKWYNNDGSQTYGGTGSWKCNASGWWYEDTSGWYPYSQWQKIDGFWYYFNSDGYMAVNEWRDGCWLGSSGAWEYAEKGSWKGNSSGWWFEDTSGWYAVNCWQKINGYWYYFGNDGYMVTNQYIDGYWISADGICY